MVRPHLVIFDLGNVLVHVDTLAVAARLGKASEDSRYHDPVTFLTDVKGRSASLLSDFELGRISPREFFEGVAATYRLNLGFEEFVQIWNSGFSENHAVSSLVLRLAQHVRLFLLSNTNALHFEHIRSTYAVIKKMEEVILSYQVGSLKPSADIYEHALTVAGLPPSRVWYVDDVPEFVDAAAQLGIHAIQYQSAAQLLMSLDAVLNGDSHR